jgi:hypothetical protein
LHSRGLRAAALEGKYGLVFGVIIGLLYVIALSVVSSALYQYATTKSASGGFSADTLASAWGPRKKRSLF